jgi:hypothetical protein
LAASQEGLNCVSIFKYIGFMAYSSVKLQTNVAGYKIVLKVQVAGIAATELYGVTTYESRLPHQLWKF